MIKIKLLIVLFSILSLNLVINQNNTVKVEASELESSSKVTESNNFNISFNDIKYPSYVEELVFVELMTLDDINAFNNWILSFNVNHNNKENILFVRNNLNKLILKAIKLNVIRDIFNQNNNRFSKSNHETILEHALDIINNDGKTGAYALFNSYESILRTAVQKPDIDESIDGTHYYVYGRGLSNTYYKNNYFINNNASYTYSISARTRFEKHYTAAINLYKNNKITPEKPFVPAIDPGNDGGKPHAQHA